MLDFITNFLAGFLLGSINVGATTQRIVNVINGQYITVWGSSIIVSASYFLGILYIVTRNIPAYLGFSLGAAVVTSYLAYRNYQAIHKTKNKKE